MLLTSLSKAQSKGELADFASMVQPWLSDYLVSALSPSKLSEEHTQVRGGWIREGREEGRGQGMGVGKAHAYIPPTIPLPPPHPHVIKLANALFPGRGQRITKDFTNDDGSTTKKALCIGCQSFKHPGGLKRHQDSCSAYQRLVAQKFVLGLARVEGG